LRLAAADGELLDFFADRLKVQQREAGVRHDLIDAVFALGGEDDLVRLLARVTALQDFVETAEGGDLLAGYKRAANILKKEKWAGEKRDSRSRGNDELESGEQALIAALDAAEPKASAAIDIVGHAVIINVGAAPVGDPPVRDAALFSGLGGSATVPDRRGAQRILLAPFLLALFHPVEVVAVLALERLAPFNLVAVAGFPLAAAAGGEECADQQAEDEYQRDNDPLVRREANHVTPLPWFQDARIQRTTGSLRSNAWEN
jgi:hypothetical protein